MAENGGTDLATENEALRSRVAQLEEENRQLVEDKARLNEEVELLQNRLNKLSRSTAGAQAQDENAEGRLPPMLQQMLRQPKDEAVQLKGIEAMFAQQAQIDGASNGNSSSSTAQASLEAACAVFVNFPDNRTLLLKASQLMSLLLSEAEAQQSLSLATVLQASEQVVASCSRLLSSIAAGEEPEPNEASSKTPPATKLLTWFLALLETTLPLLGPLLREKARGEAFLQRFLAGVMTPFLTSMEAFPENLLLKSVQLMTKLSGESWVQEACMESGVVHSLALAYHRCQQSAPEPDAPLPKALHSALRCVFAQNLELCILAIEDKFVSDEFMSIQVIEELQSMEKKQRGTLRKLDSEFAVLKKALGLWAFHERRVVEDAQPETCKSKDVLAKVAELISAVLLKLPPLVLLQRLQEFETSQVLHRIALATIHGSAPLRLQVAVGYADNGAIPVLVRATQMLLHEANEPLEVAFGLLHDEKLPADRWPYVSYCMETFKHILSHWSATKVSSSTGPQGSSALDARAAPLLLAQGGLVDVLAELIEPGLAGATSQARPPAALQGQASETLQALFEQNGHICLFCMQHYAEVRQMVSLGCESLALNPLTEFPDLQQQAVEHLSSSFERYSTGDDRLSRRILKALTILFESSYRLVAWFLQSHGLTTLSEYHSMDVHIAAVNAVTRTPYWSYEDIAILPEFVGVIAHLVLGSLEGLTDQPLLASAPSAAPRRRKPLELGEAEEVVSASTTALLHLLLIDPSPPIVLHNLSRSLAGEEVASEASSVLVESARSDENPNSEKAVTVVMQIMQVFPSSERLQLSCQHLLTSLLGG